VFFSTAKVAWHIDCAQCFQQGRKEVNRMKNVKTLLAGLILLGNVTASGTALAADGVISKTEDVPNSYCHMKFTAIRPRTLAGDQPQLKNSSSGDVIDYYGACDESPSGKDQIVDQKRDAQFRFGRDYEDGSD
jgi:hypothetical protein